MILILFLRNSLPISLMHFFFQINENKMCLFFIRYHELTLLVYACIMTRKAVSSRQTYSPLKKYPGNMAVRSTGNRLASEQHYLISWSGMFASLFAFKMDVQKCRVNTLLPTHTPSLSAFISLTNTVQLLHSHASFI